MQVEALVELPDLDPKEIQVQLYAGNINATGQIEEPATLVMEHTKLIANGRHLFTGTVECRTSGRHGFAVRILPGCADMATPFEPGLILWN
jgi:starch phosphorylase